MLGPDDLPLAELHALKLDGLLLPIADRFRAFDHPESELDRATALAGALPARVIVCEESAAWVWLGGEAPEPLRICAPTRRRARPVLHGTVVYRELGVLPGELVTVGAVVVTTPIRTAVDLARSAAGPTGRRTAMAWLAALLRDGAAAPDAVIAVLAAAGAARGAALVRELGAGLGTAVPPAPATPRTPRVSRC